MTCPTCGYKGVEAGDHRCNRCGRRLEAPLGGVARPAAGPTPLATAAAPALEPATPPEWKREVAERMEQFRAKHGQPPEGSEEETGETVPPPDRSGKVLAFEDFAAGKIEPVIVEAPQEQPEPAGGKSAGAEAKGPAPSSAPSWSSAGGAEVKRPATQRPESRPAAPRWSAPAGGKAGGAQVEGPATRRPESRTGLSSGKGRTPVLEAKPAQPPPVPRDIRCAERVAPVALRVLAGLLDGAVLTVAAGMFVGTFYLLGGGLPVQPKAAAGVALTAGVLAAFYLFLYIFYGGETPGMQWTGMRLLDYQGNPPRAGQRLVRALGTLLSAAALGLGYLWALVDEEGLTWHDRMSQTFLTRDTRASLHFQYRDPA